jgi:hypothetical protein
VSVSGASTSRGTEVSALKEGGHISGVLELIAVSHPHPTKTYGQEQSIEGALHCSGIRRWKEFVAIREMKDGVGSSNVQSACSKKVSKLLSGAMTNHGAHGLDPCLHGAIWSVNVSSECVEFIDDFVSTFVDRFRHEVVVTNRSTTNFETRSRG